MNYDRIMELICDADRATRMPSAAWLRGRITVAQMLEWKTRETTNKEDAAHTSSLVTQTPVE